MYLLKSKGVDVSQASQKLNTVVHTQTEMTRYDHLKKTAEKLMLQTSSSKMDLELMEKRVRMAEESSESKTVMIEATLNDRTKLETVLLERKKSSEKARFDLLATEALVSKLRQLVTTCQERLGNGEDDCGALRKADDERTSEIATLKDAISRATQESDRLKTELSTVVDNLTRETSTKVHLEERLNRTEASITELKGSNDTLVKEKETMEAERKQLQHQLFDIQAQKETGEADAACRESSLNEIISQAKVLQQHMDSKIVELESECRDKSERISSLSENQVALERQIERINKDAILCQERYRRDGEVSDTTILELRERLIEVLSQLKQHEDEGVTLREDIRRYTELNAQVNEELKQSQTHLQAALAFEKRVSELEREKSIEGSIRLY